MSYVPQVPRRPVPTYNDFQSQAPTYAVPANVPSQGHVDTSDEAYDQAMRIIAARQAQSSFVHDPTARQNEGLSIDFAYEMQAPALPKRRPPAPMAPMQIPEPVYIGRQSDVYVFGTDTNHLIDNSHVHVEQNRRAYARHEAQIESAAADAQRPTGRAAHWTIQEWMPYTSDIRSAGMSLEQLKAFDGDIKSVWNQAVAQVYNSTSAILLVLTMGIPLCIEGPSALKHDAWGPGYRTQRLQQVCREHNAAMVQAGVPAIFRYEQIPGVGHYLNIYHAG